MFVRWATCLLQGDASKGPALMKLLAALAYGPCPVLLDVTNGITHDVYTIRGEQLIKWTGITPNQAYRMQAKRLMAHATRSLLTLRLEQIPEEEQRGSWRR
ncbi:hypothetical protein GPECTOR_26g484 [Gonium pectorale]|uniref:Uncharacterized protein n=1 Tax=Gonium pectorale TaxID=33097 RepID=A0A150GFE6_GONPE|nr:hypothetical protein GPECTOR_26g484 [Gonium pectorale]|eukprot:KXZ48581.1 hypothetical protein GPECTOR_26g484 [Gonium pectorale]